jgi:hypothetical protein
MTHLYHLIWLLLHYQPHGMCLLSGCWKPGPGGIL